MSVKLASSRFISFSLDEFDQYTIDNLFSPEEFGERIIIEAENAQAYRQKQRVKELGLVLCQSPLAEYRLSGQYYISWCQPRKADGTRKQLEQLIEGSDRYRARALIDLGSIEAGAGNFNEGFKFYKEAIKYSRDPRATSQAIRSIAALKGIEGFHAHALKDLEDFRSLATSNHPIEQYQFLNSYAIELAQVGRITEASNICRIILASPYVLAYPEWLETSDEIGRGTGSSRSKALRSRKSEPGNVVSVEQVNALRALRLEQHSGPTQVGKLLLWTGEMAKTNRERTLVEEEGPIDRNENLASLDERQEIQEWAGDLENTTPAEIRQILNDVRRLKDKKSKQKQS